MAYLPNNQMLVSAGSDNLARLWQLPITDPRVIDGKSVAAFAATADGSKLVVAGQDKTVRIFNAADGAIVKEIPNQVEVATALAVKADGSQVAVATADRSIRFLNPADGAVQGTIVAPADISALVYLPNNQQIVVAGSDNLARLYQTAANDLRAIATNATVFAFSSDGAKAATAGADKIVRVWNVADGKTIKELPAFDQEIKTLAFNGDASQLAVALANKTVSIRKIEDASEIKKLENLPSPPTALALSGDGKLVVLATEDNHVRAFDVEMGKEIKDLEAHGGRVNALAFAPTTATLSCRR